eukprot:Gb_09652 [translate_table: standard]
MICRSISNTCSQFLSRFSSSAAAKFSLVQGSSTLPTISNGSTPQHELVCLLRNQLQPYFGPKDLLRVLKKLHFHPRFTDSVLEVFDWASEREGFRHDHTTYEWIIRNLASRDRFPEMQRVLHDMTVSPCPCSEGIFSCPRLEALFIVVINSYCRVGRLDEAMAAFEKMQKFIDGKAPVITYNILLNGMVKAGRGESARLFYGEMNRAGVAPDVFTFNILINSFCKVREVDSAIKLLREMNSKGCKPNVVSFNTLIRGLCREKRVQEGIDLSYQMLDMGCMPSVVTYNILFDSLCLEGKTGVAVDLLLDFSNRGAVPNGLDYINLIEALCRAGQVENAMNFLTDMWNKGHLPSVVTCTTLLDCLCKSGKAQEASDVLHRMLEESILPDIVTFNTLLEILCNKGRVEDAKKFRGLALVKGLDLDVVTYNILLDGFSREGRMKEGSELVDEMLDKGFIHDLGMYNRLMDGLVKPKKPLRHKHFPLQRLCNKITELESSSFAADDWINHQGPQHLFSQLLNQHLGYIHNRQHCAAGGCHLAHFSFTEELDDSLRFNIVLDINVLRYTFVCGNPLSSKKNRDEMTVEEIRVKDMVISRSPAGPRLRNVPLDLFASGAEELIFAATKPGKTMENSDDYHVPFDTLLGPLNSCEIQGSRPHAACTWSFDVCLDAEEENYSLGLQADINLFLQIQGTEQMGLLIRGVAKLMMFQLVSRASCCNQSNQIDKGFKKGSRCILLELQQKQDLGAMYYHRIVSDEKANFLLPSAAR